jgi:colanic acid biosynthesis glycosyl transferase WcaI
MKARRGGAASDGRPLRLLVLNQYYWPGIEATATLLSDLCAALAVNVEVTVVTGMLRDRPVAPGRTVHDGVTIVRVTSTAFERVRLLPRAVNYVTFLAQSLRFALREPRPDVILCMTDPPVIANNALIVAKRFRAPLIVISQDVFPEIAVELNRLENPILVALLDRLIRTYLTRADRIVAIGDTMRRRLEEKGAPPQRISVIPNWVDTKSLTPQPRENDWAKKHGLTGKFVVMHSGNIGYAHNLDNLIRAATLLRDLDNLAVVVIGHGAKYFEIVSLAERLDATRVRLLP